MKLFINQTCDQQGQRAWSVEAFDANALYGPVAYGTVQPDGISWAINQRLPAGLTHEAVTAFIDSKAGNAMIDEPSAEVVPSTVWVNGDDE